MGPHAATGLALVVHELATNAVKYGALSTAAGRIAIDWALADEDLLLRWTEDGGPCIERTPELEGFGSHLSRATVVGQLEGRLAQDWRPEGLALELSIPLAKLRD